MKLLSPDLIDAFRQVGRCEVCLRACQTEGHHILAKGMGNGSQIDHPWNLLAVCRLCHCKIESGTMTRRDKQRTQEACWEIVSRRDGIPYDTVEAAMFAIKRAPKGTDMAEHSLETDFAIFLRNTMFPGERPLLEWIRLRLKTSTPADRIQFRVMARLRGFEPDYDLLLRRNGW